MEKIKTYNDLLEVIKNEEKFLLYQIFYTSAILFLII